MKQRDYPIPTKLNLAIMVVTVMSLLFLLYFAGKSDTWLELILVGASYATVMTTGYSIIHEAEHNLLHPRKWVNDLLGSLMALFFPAPFHLLRQGHLGHHLRNRSDDEAFDYFFDGESKVWRCLVLYGTMLGTFWIVVFISNILAVIVPQVFYSRLPFVDRPTQAFQQAFNRSYLRLIQLEAAACILFHLTIIHLFSLPLANWLITLFSFGFLWSAMQYVHHYNTPRDVLQGAKNLRTYRWLDTLWLNHNWHLTHHQSPTVPWLYLPGLAEESQPAPREGLLHAYAQMWRGPRFTSTRVENRYAGKIIK